MGEAMALFGGTFDPVHYGHLRCADEARQKLGLENLYLLPAGHPPHRDTTPGHGNSQTGYVAVGVPGVSTSRD